MLAMFHCVYTDRCMMDPVSRYIYKIDIIALAQFLVSLCRAAVSGCIRKTGPAENILRSLYPVRLNVAKGDNFHSRDMGKPVDGSWSAHS
jgi:hypothetical protein